MSTIIFAVTEHTHSMLLSCFSGDFFPYSYTGYMEGLIAM